MYDEWKTGRRERKNVRERLGREGGIVFQQGLVSIIEGKKKTRMLPEKSFRSKHYRYAKTQHNLLILTFIDEE